MARPTALRKSTLASAIVVALLGAAAAQAQPVGVTTQLSRLPGEPTEGAYIGASFAVGHESNVFRVPEQFTETPDVYYVASLLGGVNQTISRQRLYADAVVRSLRYQDVTQLDTGLYSLTAGLDYEVGSDFSGNVGAIARQSIASYAVTGLPSIRDQNLENAQELRASLVWGARQRFGAEIAGALNNLDYSNELASPQNLRQSSLYGGLRYSPSDALRFGLGYRKTDGKYPDFYLVSPGSFSPLDFDRSDIDFTAVWTATGASSFSLRLSYTDQAYKQDPARDFDGFTGALSWLYQPTGRLRLSTSLYADTGSGATFGLLGTGGTTAVGQFSDEAVGLNLGAVYDLTGKIQTEATFGSTRRTFGSAIGGSETVNTYSLVARWAFSRSTSFGCLYTGENRSASSTASFDYTSNNFACFAQFVMR